MTVLISVAPPDVFLKQVDDGTDGEHSSLNMTALVIFGLVDEPDGKFVLLIKASPRRWKVEDSIEL